MSISAEKIFAQGVVQVVEFWLPWMLRANFREVPEFPWPKVGADFCEEISDLFDDWIRASAKKIAGRTESLASMLETSASFEAIFLYRLSRFIFSQKADDRILLYLSRLMKLRTGAEIYYTARIGPGLRVVHSDGIVIGPRHVIGKNFTIFQQVTLGGVRIGAKGECLTIGDDCIAFAGARILGNLVLTDRVQVAANAVLLSDAPVAGVYAGLPAKLVKLL